jgi:hypothetical protein
VTLQNRCDDLEARIDYLADELKALRGRVTGKERKTRPQEEAPSDGRLEEPAQVRPAPATTAHLARRFRGF